jgi:hypothetical protein
MRMKRFTILDFFIIALLMGCTIFFVPLMQSNAPDTMVVYKDNTAIARYPLTENRSFAVRGALGPMKIRIQDKKVWVDSATCAGQICVHTRPITQTSQQIICEPNHIVLEISPLKDTIDGVSK